jgi:hypothetical protein
VNQDIGQVLEQQLSQAVLAYGTTVVSQRPFAHINGRILLANLKA